MGYVAVTEAEIAAMDGLDHWNAVDGKLVAAFTAVSFSAAGELAAVFAAEADACDHHPDMELRYPGVLAVTLCTHAIGGLSMHDVDLARRYSEVASQRGAVPEADD